MVPFSPPQPASSSPRKRIGDRSTRPRERTRYPDPQSAAANVTPGVPPKKRKYIPGGPGGGGRYVDVDGTETPVGGTGPGGYAYSGSRGRVGRENAANGIPPTPKTYPRRRERPVATPRFSSAAAAAAAAVQGDGYKPREERGWEEFHPHLDIDARLMVFGSAEVDGIEQQLPNVSDFTSSTPRAEAVTPWGTPDVNGHSTPQTDGLAYTNSPTPVPNDQTEAMANGDILSQPDSAGGSCSTSRRRPGRPRVHLESSAAGSKTPKTIPRPTTNPREKLTLPQPSFRTNDPFISFEQTSGAYVDKSMANAGYQESDIFTRPEARLIRVAEGTVEEDLDLGPSLKLDGDTNTATGSNGVGCVEYDMDEQDDQWLVVYNTLRQEQAVETITREIFEITMTKIEKEWHSLEKRKSLFTKVGLKKLNTPRYTQAKSQATPNPSTSIEFCCSSKRRACWCSR
jgi:NuA3 HAT complex component NTO1